MIQQSELLTAMTELISAAQFYRSSVQTNHGKPSNEAINSLSMALHYAAIIEGKVRA